MGHFRFASADGTTIQGWRNHDAATGPPVVISNGLGTPPSAWPALAAPDSGLRTLTWYYRGTGGSERPADRRRIRVEDHVADLRALLDHEGVDSAVLACWSLGVNVGFAFARRYPERVSGLLAVAGVPGGTFEAMFGLLRLPRPLRHPTGVAAARLGWLLGPVLSGLARRVPLTRATALAVNHSGFVLPAARPDVLLPALAEFRGHDFRWYFALALAAADHRPMDLGFVRCPTTLVAGRWDVLTYRRDLERAAAQIPHARLVTLDGSHFLPLERPAELARLVRELGGAPVG